MAFLTNTFTDATSQTTVHAAHHNALANHAANMNTNPLYKSTRVMTPRAFTQLNSAQIPTYVQALCFTLPACTIGNISINVATTGASNVDFYLYGSTTAGHPSGILASSTNIDTTATGTVQKTIGLTLSDRTELWQIIRPNTTSATPTLSTYLYNTTVKQVFNDATELWAGTSAMSRVYTSLVAGSTMPTDLTSTSFGAGGNPPIVGYYLS